MSSRYFTETDAENLKLLEDAVSRIKIKAGNENRSLTTDEAEMVKKLSDAIFDLKKIPYPPQTLERNFSYDSSGRRVYGNTGAGGSYQIKGPRDSKDYRSLFGVEGPSWTDKDIGFFGALCSGRHHPGLTQRSMLENVPSSGGFLVPVQTSQRIHDVALENEIILPRAYVIPMISNELKIPATVIGSHASALMGGFTASFTAEAGTIDENSPKVRNMTLTAKKLTGLVRFSAELASDAIGGERQIETICARGLAHYRDASFISGSGAGEPQGLLNSACLVTTAKEVGQKADTLTYENVCKMMAAMYPPSFKNSIWIAHPSTIPQLLSLSLAVGTGGNQVNVFSESNGRFQMLTREVIFSEKMQTLGNKGDICLVDLSQFCVALRAELRVDLSIHTYFTTDELLLRLISQFDGQMLWNEPLTLSDGVTQVSPVVTLAERA